MLEGATGVLVGYSGGADSTALLHLLKERCDTLGIYVHAMHIHHGIRGEEADRDAEFCQKTCAALGVDFSLVCADIPSLARECGRGVEEVARDFRYSQFLEKIRADSRLSHIATAHNADDNAETVIFNLTRGSGIDGLCGIPPVRTLGGVPVIRPLLNAKKCDIVGYLRENGIDFIFDSTNDDTVYTRNYIRHEIIPSLERLNPSLHSSVKRASDNLRADAEYLDDSAKRFVDENTVCDGISVAALSSVPAAIATRAVREMYSRVSGAMLERVHVDAVLSLAKVGKPHSEACLADGVRAVCDREYIYFTKEANSPAIEFEHKLSEGANCFAPPDFAVLLGGVEKTLEDLQKDNETLQNIYNLSIQEKISFDKINDMLYVRSRRDGDAYTFGGMTRRLKKLYNDKDWSLKKRAETPVFCDGEGIVWVPGFPVADRVKTGEKYVNIIYYYNGDKKC